MTVELTMLVYSGALLLVLVLIQAAAGVAAQGPIPMANSRDDLPPPKPFQARTRRVVDNHREGLIIFAPFVLAAAVAHVSNYWTVLGSELFFYSRLIHAGLYLAGVPMIRPLVWAVGLAGAVMVLLAVLRAASQGPQRGCYRGESGHGMDRSFRSRMTRLGHGARGDAAPRRRTAPAWLTGS
jgi:uncharacterized MAPEG superfamily protein